LLQTLQSAVETYIGSYVYPNTAPSGSSVVAAVNSINSALNSLSTSQLATQSQSAYYSILNSLSNEVANVNKASIVFNAGYSQNILTYAQAIISQSNDSTQYHTNQFLSNLITNDVYGDTIRSVIAETNNLQKLGSAGISNTNDPNPSLLIAQSNSKNIPLSTYITQNQ
jgi:hypothetical protein